MAYAEVKSVRYLIQLVLDAGYEVDINDGEETVITKSTDVDAIMETMMSTDEDIVRISHPSRESRIGAFYLVYGNSPEEVICDHTDNEACGSIADAHAKEFPY